MDGWMGIQERAKRGSLGTREENRRSKEVLEGNLTQEGALGGNGGPEMAKRMSI